MVFTLPSVPMARAMATILQGACAYGLILTKNGKSASGQLLWVACVQIIRTSKRRSRRVLYSNSLLLHTLRVRCTNHRQLPHRTSSYSSLNLARSIIIKRTMKKKYISTLHSQRVHLPWWILDSLPGRCSCPLECLLLRLSHSTTSWALWDPDWTWNCNLPETQTSTLK